MLKNTRKTILFALIALTTSACGEGALGPGDDDDNDDMGWGATEQQALLTALNTSGALTRSPIAGFASMVVGTLSDVGTIRASQVAAMTQSVQSGIQMAITSSLSSTYDGAFGIHVGYELDGVQGWLVGILGWNGLDSQTNTVTELVSVYHFDTGSNQPPATHSADIGIDDGFLQLPPRGASDHHLATGTYWDGTDTFWGMSGSMDFTGSSFSGSTDCSQVSFSCTYSTGSMSGSFDFAAGSLISEMSWTQVPVSFSNLTAVQLMISPGL